MEDLTPCITILKNLRYQARKLTSTGLSLTNLFAQEASRLNRKDEASRLKTLYSSMGQQLDRVKHSEDAASDSHCKVDIIASVVKLAVGSTIKMTSKDKLLSAISGRLLNNLAGKQRPFGTVVVSIGPKGLPDDVGVVSISRSARESNREEPEVIDDLQECGYLLFSEKTFSLLIDKLINDVQEGRLHLPIPAEKLFEITTSSSLELEHKKSD